MAYGVQKSSVNGSSSHLVPSSQRDGVWHMCAKNQYLQDRGFANDDHLCQVRCPANSG